MSLAVGATGAYDGYFVALSKTLVASGQGSSIIRLGYEFNEQSFPWTALGQPANFITYWRQIVTSMRSVPGANFRFVWNPYIGGDADLANYYPGNAYVELVGLDVYEESNGNIPDKTSEFSGLETEPYGLDWLASFAATHSKSTVLPQWGIGAAPSQSSDAISVKRGGGSDDGDATFVSDMLQWISSHGVVEATYWDYGLGAVGSGANTEVDVALAHWDE
jgi:hypothetical protein